MPLLQGAMTGEMTLDKMIAGKMNLYKMTLDKMIVGKMTLDEMT